MKVRYFFLAKHHLFDSWHSNSPYECRGYKSEVVRLAANLEPQVVVEIGCGLGEILSRISCTHRYGFDSDSAVIDAAHHLYGSKCVFACADVADVNVISDTIGSRPVDLLVMVNWPHALIWDDLSKCIRNLAHLLGLRFLVIDSINPGISGYPYHHTVEKFSSLGDILYSHSSIDGVRTLLVISLNFQ